MKSEEIRKRFLTFFEKREHKILPSASLIPHDDPSVLFTTAGMQPLTPYLLGQLHPLGKRLVNVQKCVRTQDIEEVGDATHDTFFEMLGNWSLGDYFKDEAISWSYDLLTDPDEGFGLNPNRLYITCFGGDENAPKDEESARIWERVGIPTSQIYFLDKEENWWSPGDNGPSGPDTEMFYDVTPNGLGKLTKEQFREADEKQNVVEIWNDVFMEYEKKDGKVVGKLKQRNVDTGAGLERLAVILQGKDNIFDTDLFESLMSKISELSINHDIRAKRIVADHLRTAVFLISDGVAPSNSDRGYVLRRLIRRAIRYSDVLGIDKQILASMSDIIVDKYRNIYSNLLENRNKIVEELEKEEILFRNTLEKGMRQFKKIGNGEISGKDAFLLYQTYGFPFELTKELALEKGNAVDKEGYERELAKHQNKSRVGAEKKFAGGLADHSEDTIKLHTAHHILLAALKRILGSHVKQRGSNITRERLRIDFSHNKKVSNEELLEIEKLVNEKINKGLPIVRKDMSKDEAEKLGAEMEFGVKYGDRVSVYFIEEDSEDFSKEFCGGPHVDNTSSLGHFKIIKEEASSQGVRRIKANLE